MLVLIQRIVLAVAMTLSVAAAGGQAAQAGDCGFYYQRVVTYVCERVPYEVCLTKYDHCGQPYHVYVTRYRTVETPVVKLVKVYR